jgi:hypothetical protein
VPWGFRLPLKRPKAATTTTGTVTSATTIVTADLIDVITVIAGPIVAMMTGIDMIITAIIAATTDVTTIITMTAMIDVRIARMIIVTTSATIAGVTDVMTDVARTTTTATTTTIKNGLHHHHLKGATPTMHSRWPTERLTSSSAVAKRSKATDRTDQTPGRSGMLTLKTRSLCIGPNSQSLSPGKTLGSHP